MTTVSFTQHCAIADDARHDPRFKPSSLAALLVAHYDGLLPAGEFAPLTEAERDNVEGRQWIDKLRAAVRAIDPNGIELAAYIAGLPVDLSVH